MVANKTMVPVVATGNVLLKTIVNKDVFDVTVKNVLCVPQYGSSNSYRDVIIFEDKIGNPVSENSAEDVEVSVSVGGNENFPENPELIEQETDTETFATPESSSVNESSDVSEYEPEEDVQEQGSAVETEKCGTSLKSRWDCLYGDGSTYIQDVVAEMPEVQAEVGTYCRCGCVVHLGQAKPSRLLATSSQSCPGRNFWLIQVTFYFLEYLCIVSDSIKELQTNIPFCSSRFNVSVVPVAQNIGVIPVVILKLTAVHITAIFFLSGLLLATVMLGVQYIFRYRKYQVADGDDQDSISNLSDVAVPLGARVSSNATLFSEVISLSRLGPHLKLRGKHIRLRESADCETLKLEEKVTLAKQESLSIGSTTTLTQFEASTLPIDESEDTTINTSLTTSTLKRSSTIESDKDKSDEKTQKGEESIKQNMARRPSNISNITLTNGCYSSGGTLVNKATIKSTSVKETKEKKNRERLMLGPTGSDFSISAQDIDLEMDYYDYNVVNAGAAPGSYL
uniref:Uncharacterized protein LOC114336299 n=1 Tax=Diabrotica virgifera virgifera TaxID=50390 RepID=A0A6P7GEA4_DIAVI